MADLFEVERDVSFPFDFRLIAKDTKVSNVRIDQIAFLTAGNYPGEDAAEGFERALDLFHAGEALGYDGAWIRQRHLERAVSSAATFLAAASQRTTRIGLGAAVIQMGYENPFRLAEDLATVDVLSSGRLNVGQRGGADSRGAAGRTPVRHRSGTGRLLACPRGPAAPQSGRRLAR